MSELQTDAKTWQVWATGWRDNGGSSPASLLGEASAPSFEEACEMVANTKHPELFDRNNLTYWGCGLFDNEAQARQSFG